MQRQQERDRRIIDRNLRELGIRKRQSSTPVYAYVSEGRWVADCDECNGAEFVTEDQVMVCGTCGAVSDVVWPEDVAGIEAVLGKRKHLRTQNFIPGETVDMLKAENKRHGVK